MTGMNESIPHAERERSTQTEKTTRTLIARAVI